MPSVIFIDTPVAPSVEGQEVQSVQNRGAHHLLCVGDIGHKKKFVEARDDWDVYFEAQRGKNRARAWIQRIGHRDTCRTIAGYRLRHGLLAAGGC